MQGYTSAKTSINSKKLPAVYRKFSFGERVLDFGCGRYTDHIRKALPVNTTYMPYDPYNQPDEINQQTIMKVAEYMANHIPVDVVCSNVLNVIDDEETLWNISGWIQLICNKTGGHAYITVYEGDRSGIGRATGFDQYQRNEPLKNYLRFFPTAVIRKQTIIY